MKKTMMSLLCTALMFVFVSCGNKSGQEDSKEVAEEQNDEKLDDTKLEDDSEFAVEAADGGMMEVQLGTLALTKAQSPQVKQFAQMMVDDHGKANNELKTLAQQKNITLPTTLSDESQKHYDNINEKNGADFDKEYIDHMVKDHKDDIDKFEKQSKDGKDADLKNWAAGKLPTLRNHLDMAEKAQEALKNNNRNN